MAIYYVVFLPDIYQPLQFFPAEVVQTLSRRVPQVGIVITEPEPVPVTPAEEILVERIVCKFKFKLATGRYRYKLGISISLYELQFAYHAGMGAVKIIYRKTEFGRIDPHRLFTAVLYREDISDVSIVAERILRLYLHQHTVAYFRALFIRGVFFCFFFFTVMFSSLGSGGIAVSR